jgi:hypothetical protein
MRETSSDIRVAVTLCRPPVSLPSSRVVALAALQESRSTTIVTSGWL